MQGALCRAMTWTLPSSSMTLIRPASRCAFPPTLRCPHRRRCPCGVRSAAQLPHRSRRACAAFRGALRSLPARRACSVFERARRQSASRIVSRCSTRRRLIRVQLSAASRYSIAASFIAFSRAIAANASSCDLPTAAQRIWSWPSPSGIARALRSCCAHHAFAIGAIRSRTISGSNRRSSMPARGVSAVSVRVRTVWSGYPDRALIARVHSPAFRVCDRALRRPASHGATAQARAPSADRVAASQRQSRRCVRSTAGCPPRPRSWRSVHTRTVRICP